MGFDKIVKYIIEDLKDETWKDEQVNLVYWACQTQRKKTLDVLVRNGATWTKDWKIEGTSFLQKAVIDGNLEGVKTIMVKEYFEANERMYVRILVEAHIEITTAKDIWEPILKIIKDKDPSFWKNAIREL